MHQSFKILNGVKHSKTSLIDV